MMDDFKFYRRLNRMYLAFALFFIGLLELGALFGDIIFMLFGFACALVHCICQTGHVVIINLMMLHFMRR